MSAAGAEYEPACTSTQHSGFFAHSELPIVIQRVEVAGRIDPASLAELDRGRIAQELRALGFP